MFGRENGELSEINIGAVSEGQNSFVSYFKMMPRDLIGVRG